MFFWNSLVFLMFNIIHDHLCFIIYVSNYKFQCSDISIAPFRVILPLIEIHFSIAFSTGMIVMNFLHFYFVFIVLVEYFGQKTFLLLYFYFFIFIFTFFICYKICKLAVLCSQHSTFYLPSIFSSFFCVAEFIKWKRDRESFWHRHQKGDRVSPLLILAREL